MSRAPPQETSDAELRALYEEYELQAVRVAMISDPENEYAWIQSNHTIAIEA